MFWRHRQVCCCWMSAAQLWAQLFRVLQKRKGQSLHMGFCRRLYSASSPRGPGTKSPGVRGSRGLYRKGRGWGRTSGAVIEGSGAEQGGSPMGYNGSTYSNNAFWGKLLPHHDHRGFCSMVVPPGEGGSPYLSWLTAPTEFGNTIKGSICSYLYLCFSLFLSHPISISFCFENIKSQN